MNKKVLVLLSTFNGIEYFEEQILSILSQENIEIHLRIRDDGSSKEFIQFLFKYESYKNLELTYGKNLGISRSYWSMLKSIEDLDSYSAIAFADQDDIWSANKISEGLRILDSYKMDPFIYSSGYTLINPHSKLIGGFKPEAGFLKPENFYVQNISLGATQLLNPVAVRILQNFPPPKFIMHDAWAALIVAHLGFVYLDSQQTIQYRLHDSNAVGRKSRLHAAINFRQNISRHLNELAHFINLNSKLKFLPEASTQMYKLNKFLKIVHAESALTRFRLISNLKVYRRTFYQSLIFYLIVLIFGF